MTGIHRAELVWREVHLAEIMQSGTKPAALVSLHASSLSPSQLTSISVALESILDSSGPPPFPSRIPKMSFGVSSTLRRRITHSLIVPPHCHPRQDYDFDSGTSIASSGA